MHFRSSRLWTVSSLPLLTFTAMTVGCAQSPKMADTGHRYEFVRVNLEPGTAIIVDGVETAVPRDSVLTLDAGRHRLRPKSNEWEPDTSIVLDGTSAQTPKTLDFRRKKKS